MRGKRTKQVTKAELSRRANRYVARNWASGGRQLTTSEHAIGVYSWRDGYRAARRDARRKK